MPYRKEIDGLRAIAFASVLLYHAKITAFGDDLFAGGFIGVDIFFVISGYLITGIILDEIRSSGSVSLLNFYERRARRIVPMLVLTLLISVPFAVYHMFPSALVEFANSLIAALFFGSNIFFYLVTTEYGADSSLLKPLLHTWSLSVEEQFYLVLPAIALMVRRLRQLQFAYVMTLLTTASLSFCVVASQNNADLNFFLPFGRFWELTFGSLLASLDRRYQFREQQGAFDFLPILGVGLIALSIFGFNEATIHPGVMTLVPVLGSVLVLGFASKHNIVGRILGAKPLVGLGLISYSAYLWHYPIFAFARMSEEPTIYAKGMLIAATVTVAIISHRFIERPFRDSSIVSRSLFIKSVVAGVLAAILMAVFIISRDGFEAQHYFELMTNFDVNEERIETKRKSLKTILEADFQQLTASNVLVVGNSHSLDIASALYQNRNEFAGAEFKRFGIQLACLDTTVQANLRTQQDFFSSSLYQYADLIIVSSRLALQGRPCSKGHSDSVGDEFVGVKTLLARAQLDGKRSIVMGQSPVFQPKVDNELLWHSFFKDAKAQPELIEADGFEYFNKSAYNYIVSNSTKKEALLRDIAKQYEAYFISKYELVCTDAVKRCDVVSSGGNRYFADHNHYSFEGAAFFGKRLAQQKDFKAAIERSGG